MANDYDIKDGVALTGTFTDSAGTATDPTIVILKVKQPDGTVASYAYGLSSQGAWSAAANSPALADGTGTAGHYYTVSAAGSVDFGNGSIVFTTSDIVFYNGERWEKLVNFSTTAITKSSTGIYTLTYKVYYAGKYWYRWEGEGTGDAGEEEYFTVDESEFY